MFFSVFKTGGRINWNVRLPAGISGYYMGLEMGRRILNEGLPAVALLNFRLLSEDGKWMNAH